MIPRSKLFGHPRRAAANISPDGKWISWAASGADVMNVWVAPMDDQASARQLTFDQRRGVSGHQWCFDSVHILFSQDKDGDENNQVYAVDVHTGVHRCLTPYPGCRASVVAMSRKRRDEVLISLNRRDPRFADLFTLHLPSGELGLVLENPGYGGFIVDQDLRPRVATRSTTNAGTEVLIADAEGRWLGVSLIGPEDANSTGPSHLDCTGKLLYGYDSRNRDTAALTVTDLESGRVTVLGENSLSDIAGLLTDGHTFAPLAYRTHYERSELHILDESIRRDVDFLESQDLGNWMPTAGNEADDIWIVHGSSDTSPGATFIFHRVDQRLTKLYDLRPELADCALARMQSAVVPARDGLPLVCYLTLPRAADTGRPLSATMPSPLVLYVHGGPWARDHFGYDPTHQWLADRGYAVLNVNFRSSTGLGKRFLNAGNGEWGRKMDDDLEDAVQWAIDAGLVDHRRMAIAGASYGGYAVLSALTRLPGRYVCGVDIFGPTNLETLLDAIPAHWEDARQMLYRAIADPRTPEGKQRLRERSPLHAAGSIRDPLLIGQGANDPRVRQAESDQMVKALRGHGTPVTYALFPDEGHGFQRQPNRLIFNAVMEAFLARYLGGSLEPFEAADFPGNTLELQDAAYSDQFA